MFQTIWLPCEKTCQCVAASNTPQFVLREVGHLFRLIVVTLLPEIHESLPIEPVPFRGTPVCDNQALIHQHGDPHFGKPEVVGFEEQVGRAEQGVHKKKGLQHPRDTQRLT